MRVGISSANASDNWTNSKLSGGMVVNFCMNFTDFKRLLWSAHYKGYQRKKLF
eukprot:UN17071